MIVDVPYNNLEHTLKALKIQVIDSLPYISNYIPNDIETPEQLFRYLKSKTTYKKDPHNVELLQMVPTLMKRGGKGDCDCFTILTLTSCYFLNFKPLYVSLVGKSSIAPSHIYSEVYDRQKNEICPMDLTNPYYCMERSYPFKQRLKFTI
jgi:hypothetical protein